MVVLARVPFAFVAADSTRHDTGGQHGLAQVEGLGRPAGQHPPGRLAHVGTVEVEPDALAQHLDVGLGEAGVGARGAGLCALEAGLDALEQCREVCPVLDGWVVVKHLFGNCHVDHLDR